MDERLSASELAKKISEMPRKPHPDDLRRQTRPALRPAPDATVEVKPGTKVQDVLGQLAAERVRHVGLTDAEGDIKAIVLTPEEYLDLATARLAANDGFHIADGKFFYPKGTQAAAYGQNNLAADYGIEQVDPNENWDAYVRRDQNWKP